MTFTELVKYLPRINIIIILVLFFDFYILPSHDILEKPDHEMLERSLSKRSRSYLTYSLVSKSGHKYHIPEEFERLVPTDSDFTIQKTFLLHLRSRIICHTVYGSRRFNISYLNSNGFVQIFLAGLFAVSIYNLTFPGQENAKTNLIGLSILSYFVLTIILLFG